MLTQKRLTEVLSYNKETGVFTRKIATAMRNKVGEEAGYVDANGYRRITIDSVKYYAHRLVFLYVDDDVPDTVDHINRVTTDNSYVNLRNTTQAVNCKNSSLQHNNSLGIAGIIYKHNKFYVRIGHSNSVVCLGCYESFFDACCIRKSAENKFNFHKTYGQEA